MGSLSKVSVLSGFLLLVSVAGLASSRGIVPKSLKGKIAKQMTAWVAAGLFSVGGSMVSENVAHAAKHGEPAQISQETGKWETGINAKDADGNTALHKAVYYAAISEVDSLLARGADPRIENNEGMTPYDYAMEFLEPQFRDENSVEIYVMAALMLRNMAGINGTDKDGWTPLNYALAYTGYINDIKKHYGEPDYRDHEYYFKEYEYLSQKLIAEGADIRRVKVYDRPGPLDSYLIDAFTSLKDENLFLTLVEEQDGVGVLAKKFANGLSWLVELKEFYFDDYLEIAEYLHRRISYFNNNEYDPDTAKDLKAVIDVMQLLKTMREAVSPLGEISIEFERR